MIPENLVREMAGRRCIPFVGSGLSAHASAESGAQPPRWRTLLDGLLPLAPPEDRDVATELMDRESYLDAAEIILSKRDTGEFSVRLREILEAPKFRPGAVHAALVALDAKIVVTTNYDTLIEQAAQAAGVTDLRVCRYYEDHAINVLRSDAPLLFKAHGCIQHPHLAVLSRSDYFSIRAKHPYSQYLLNSLLHIFTVVFLGYSIADPDIRLILENVRLLGRSDHPHYALLPSGLPPAIVEAMQRSYNIRILPYDNASGDHTAVPEWLDEFVTRVQAARAL